MSLRLLHAGPPRTRGAVARRRLPQADRSSRPDQAGGQVRDRRPGREGGRPSVCPGHVAAQVEQRFVLIPDRAVGPVDGAQPIQGGRGHLRQLSEGLNHRAPPEPRRVATGARGVQVHTGAVRRLIQPPATHDGVESSRQTGHHRTAAVRVRVHQPPLRLLLLVPPHRPALRPDPRRLLRVPRRRRPISWPTALTTAPPWCDGSIAGGGAAAAGVRWSPLDASICTPPAEHTGPLSKTGPAGVRQGSGAPTVES